MLSCNILFCIDMSILHHLNHVELHARLYKIMITYCVWEHYEFAQNMLSDIVCNVSILYSVHFEEIPFDVIRTAIISAISQAKLIDRPPTILEFNSMWNAEVSLLVKKPKRVHRVDKSLRSIVFGLFHDRRGKISHVARTAWLSIFGGVSDELGKPDVTVRQGVTSLSSSTADCWSFFHVRSRSEDAPVFRVVKRMFLPVPPLSDTQEPYLASVRPTQSAQITINPDIDAVMPDPPTTRTAHPVLPPAVVIVRKVTNPAPISALPDDRMPSVPVPVQPLWKAFITAISDAHYKSVYLGTDPDLGFGNDLEEEQASTGPPSADIEWSIHPGSLTFVANVLAAPCISKTTGLTVDIERDPKSKRIVSIVTNASPRLESFILSIVSQRHDSDCVFLSSCSSTCLHTLQLHIPVYAHPQFHLHIEELAASPLNDSAFITLCDE